MFKYSKDGVSVLTVLDTRRPKQSGLFPVKVQIVYKRIQKYYSTGKELPKNDWKILSATKSKNLLSIREDIEISFNKVRETVKYLTDEGDFTFDALNVRLGRSAIGNINDTFHARIENLRNEGRVGTRMFYECALKSISSFEGGKISFDSITTTWLKKYEKYMLDKGKAYTTIGMYLRALRAVINDAIKIGMIKAGSYPFGKNKYEIPEGEGRKLALTIKQIKKVITYTDGTKTTERYRDLWFFSYLCNGINIIDLVKLQNKDILNGELSYYRSKTLRTSKKKSKIQVIVTPEMNKIIEHWGNKNKKPDSYVFSYLKGSETPEDVKRIVTDVTKRINVRMKSISQALNLPHISTYTARHSFATVLKRSGANIAYISESLGHSDLKTTENYLASFEREEREKNAKLLTDFGE